MQEALVKKRKKTKKEEEEENANVKRQSKRSLNIFLYIVYISVGTRFVADRNSDGFAR